MGDYWSCSKFADWVRGTPALAAGTSEEWAAWRLVAKRKKIRYWLAEEGIDYLQNFICWPINQIRAVRYYINNRWISKTHAFTSTLERGQWYDFDMRFLHSAFDALVDFVEIEQAWMQVVFSEEERKKYKTPWYRTVFRIRSWRSPEAGLAHLAWASTLTNADYVDKDDPTYGHPSSQAQAAIETLTLYRWWKEDRPKRSDPMDVSGWSAYCAERQKAAQAREDRYWIGSTIDETDEMRERASKMCEACHKLEKEQEDEDTAMLIRLVKLRKHLWT